jgi:hypothetical protein
LACQRLRKRGVLVVQQSASSASEVRALLADRRNAKGDMQVQHLLDHRAVLQREPLVAVTIMHGVVHRLDQVPSGVKPYWRKSLLVSHFRHIACLHS